MALREAASNLLHKAGDLFQPRATGGAGERGIALAMPGADYRPVNEPGSESRMVKNAFYRLIGEDGRDKGMVFLCRCGVSNAYLFGKYNLTRELELEHNCTAGCASVIQKINKSGEITSFEQVRHVRHDEKGNPIPVGAPFSLLDCLPNRGKGMSDAERDKCYATLPTWRLGTAAKQQPPFIPIGDWGSSDVTKPEVGWGGDKRAEFLSDINNGLW